VAERRLLAKHERIYLIALKLTLCFIATLENTPPPNAALKTALKNYQGT
jgi:uncharacterized protein (DUF1778 family)